MTGQGSSPSRAVAPIAVIVAIVLTALVLRGPLVAVAPIATTIREALDLTAGEVGLLTALPVLCFALATPFASLLIARAGPDAATLVCLLGVIAGSGIRSAGGIGALFAGTVLIGVFITVGNVVVPVIIRRDVTAARVGIATGLYTSALNVGSMLTSLGTAPLADAIGWQGGLAFWLVLPVVAAVFWTLLGRRRNGSVGDWLRSTRSPSRRESALPSGAADAVSGSDDTAATADASGARSVSETRRRPWRSLTAILLALAFAGQAFSYYGTTAWLPSLLRDEIGYSLSEAGIASSVFQISAIIGAPAVPLLAGRLGPRATIAALFTGWLSVPLGLLFAPQLHLLWELIGGAAQGGGITAVFIIVVRLATGGDDARRLSAFVQGAGYAVAATAPTVLGLAHDATGEWTVPLLCVLAGVLCFGAGGIAAAHRSLSREGG